MFVPLCLMRYPARDVCSFVFNEVPSHRDVCSFVFNEVPSQRDVHSFVFNEVQKNKKTATEMVIPLCLMRDPATQMFVLSYLRYMTTNMFIPSCLYKTNL